MRRDAFGVGGAARRRCLGKGAPEGEQCWRLAAEGDCTGCPAGTGISACRGMRRPSWLPPSSFLLLIPSQLPALGRENEHSEGAGIIFFQGLPSPCFLTRAWAGFSCAPLRHLALGAMCMAPRPSLTQPHTISSICSRELIQF